jgi:4-amino-4-deoxy-L-arabinose transferase-like glycosyltransferase
MDFAVTQDFLDVNGAGSIRLLKIARFACIPFSLLGASICYKWASSLYGVRSGLVAMLLWCASPFVLANAALITPDAHASALCLAASFAFWKWLDQSSWRNTVLSGTLLGLAQLSKTTLIVLFILWPLIFTLDRFARGIKRTLGAIAAEGFKLIVIFVVAGTVLNAGYGFDGTFRRLGELQFTSRLFAGPDAASSNRFAGHWFAGIRVPLPENYLLGIDEQKSHFEAGRSSYLFGQWQDRGWWYFYIVAYVTKAPLGSLLLFVLAATLSRPAAREMTLWISMIGLFVFVSAQ